MMKMKKMQKSQKAIILDNIRSVFNVGSIFRTADALGVDKLFLCGTTPTPIDRFGRVRNDLAKVALGAEKNVAWEYVKNTTTVLKKLKKEKFQIIAIEQDKRSVNIKKVKAKNSVALVLGNEVDGIDKKILKLADAIAEIPMHGKKESLNVGVAFGIAGYAIFNS